MHDNDVPQLSRHDGGQQTWEDWISAFIRDAYPVFRRHGISLESAMVIYSLNETQNALRGVGARADDEDDDEDEE